MCLCQRKNSKIPKIRTTLFYVYIFKNSNASQSITRPSKVENDILFTLGRNHNETTSKNNYKLN